MTDSELKTWFLGHRGQNAKLLHDLMHTVIERAVQWREQHVANPGVSSAAGTNTNFERRVTQLLDYLQPRTVPAFSSRYQAHMGWDLMLPGLVGQMVGMLFPSNNVAYEGSPGTTVLEMLVGADLCRMLGYKKTEQIVPWGHLVGGGTIGNIEALWAARNLKFLPLALRELVSGPFKEAEAVTVTLRDGQEKALAALGCWQLLNLPVDESLALPARVAALLPEGRRSAFENELNQKSANQRGVHYFVQHLAAQSVGAPKILLSHDNHYSLEKAVALLGLGQDCLQFITVDAFGHMNVDELKAKLNECEQKQEPVLAVVVNLGSTELGAVDDLARILGLREALRGKLEFPVHVDAAFGGYHASLLHDDDFNLEWPFKSKSGVGSLLRVDPIAVDDQVPEVGLSQYVEKQYLAMAGADSITVDPHKLGFLPTPGGAVCYRNSALRDLTKFSAPYLGAIVPQGIAQLGERTDQFIGVFGVEGSRPGGSAAAVFLAHCLMRPNKKGYGRLSGKELYASKRVFAALMLLDQTAEGFGVAVPGPYPKPGKELESIIAIARKPDSDIDDGDLPLLAKFGPDLNLLCYAFNFKRDDGEWNQDLLWMNVFNMLIYGQLELQPAATSPQRLIVSRTIFSGREGTSFISGMLERSRCKVPRNVEKADLVALRSAEWNPWLTEQDPMLEDFRTALNQMATEARDMLLGAVDKFEQAVCDMRAAGLGDLEIATGIIGTLAARARQSRVGMHIAVSEIAASDIARGLKMVMEKLAAPGLPEEALSHFAGKPTT